MSRHCECSPDCRQIAEPGQPFSITHDPRPERQAERSRIMAERGRKGGQQFGENRQALAEDDAEVADLSNTAGRRAAINRAVKRVFTSGINADKLAAAVSTLVKASLDVDRVAVLEDENKELRAIIESNPELKRKLRVVP